jgi:ferredoxin-type protein NapH
MYQKIRKPIVISTAILFHVLLIFHLLFSPVIIVFAAYKSIVNASFIAFIAIFILSLFFGRAFCAWFCPGCGIQEILNFFIKRKSINSKTLYIKYFIFAIWIAIILFGYISNGIHKVDLSYGMTDITIKRKIILTIGSIVMIAPLTVLFGKFASCKYICWIVPFMIIGTKIRNYFNLNGLRLKCIPEKCNECKSCDKNCPMNLKVMSSVITGKFSDNECILCGECIDHCKQKALMFSFKK